MLGSRIAAVFSENASNLDSIKFYIDELRQVMLIFDQRKPIDYLDVRLKNVCRIAG